MRLMFAFALAAIGCGDADTSHGPSSRTVDASTGARLLGIERFEIVETETTLSITGRAHDKTEIGRLDLFNGPFYMDQDDRGWVVGRKLTIAIDQERAVHESAGFYRVDLPLPDVERIAVFVTDPAVADSLESWDIGLAVDPSQDGQIISTSGTSSNETPYAICDQYGAFQAHVTGGSPCNSANSLCNGSAPKWVPTGCASYDCAMSTNSGEKTQFTCCFSSSTAVRRACVDTPYGGTSCGGSGPGACAPCWSQSYVGWCSATGSSICAIDFCSF